jgi:integrase/recombinase XerD
VDEAIRRFLAYLQNERGASANTLQAYQADLRQLARFQRARLGRPSAPADLTPESLSSFIRWLDQQGFRPATIARKAAAIRSFLDYLGSRAGLDVPVGTEALHLPPAPRSPRRVLSQAEVASLLAAPTGSASPRAIRDAAILALLYATGLRATEVVGLRLEDVDLGQGLVFRLGGKADDDQALSLGKSVEPLRRYLQEGRPSLVREPGEAALFLNPRGKRLSRQGLWLVIRRWAAACGLVEEVSPHTLRRSLAQHLLEAGEPRRRVQTLLGLSSPNTLTRPPPTMSGDEG